MRMRRRTRIPGADDPTAVMRLLALTDSALPIGAFAFSNGLETAASEGLVRDAATLEEFVGDAVRQTLFTDGVAALHARRSHAARRYEGILEADRRAMNCKLCGEMRLMSLRMGRKLAELSQRIFPDRTIAAWLRDAGAGLAPGSYAAAQGMVFSANGIGDRQLAAAHIYGTANMILNAALRCIRVTHYDTQRILHRLGDEAGELCDEACDRTLDDMAAFAPLIDILASMHEKGSQRMFMN